MLHPVLFVFSFCFFFFFNDTATTEIYTLSLHDALPIYVRHHHRHGHGSRRCDRSERRSEEHTSELQSLAYLVCRLLLEKKKTNKNEMLTIKKKKHNQYSKYKHNNR